MAKATLASLLFAITLISGCGGNFTPQATPTQQVLTAADIFANKAETWTFQNKFGDITTIEVIPIDANHTTWHYTKTATRAYWAPSVPQAESWFDLERDATGAWYSTGGIFNEPQGGPGCGPGNPYQPVCVPIITQRYPVPQTPGQPRPYLILPAKADFSYSTTFDDTIPIGDGQYVDFPGAPWKTSGYMEDCDTPVYKGQCYVSDQFEGLCIHEKWDFAPRLGLVKVSTLYVPECGTNSAYQDDSATMVRIPNPPNPNPLTITGDQVFNMSMVGETWTFQNAYGDTTTVAVEAAPTDAAGTQGNHVILHFTKTADRAYWGLGIAQAEDHFLMFQNPDGSWRGAADIPTFPSSCPWCSGHTAQTLNPRPVPGLPLPYSIVPAIATEGVTTTAKTQYEMWNLWDVNTTDDIVNPPTPSEQGTDMGRIDWNTEFSIEQVDTPIYSGPAIVSHQFESCNEERWFFAPNIGLVQITPMGTCSPTDSTRLTIKRIQ